MPTLEIPTYTDQDADSQSHATGGLLIGTARWVSDGTSIQKNNGAVVVSGTAFSADPDLGHDPSNAYLLVHDSTTRVRRYSGIAGTTITFVDSITLDNAVAFGGVGFAYDDTNAVYYFIDDSGQTIRKFNSSGTTVSTTSIGTNNAIKNVKGLCFIHNRLFVVTCSPDATADVSTSSSNLTIGFIPTSITR
jgi:hypothetical protein